MARTALLLLALAHGAGGARGQSPYTVTTSPPEGFARDSAGARTLAHLLDLIRLDTRNPPGNERLAAEYLASAFAAIPGVETEIIDAGDGRAHLVARLRADNPRAPSVLVTGHLDVVGADTAAWGTDPFEPFVDSTHVYGRGVIDDKGPVAAAVTALELLARDRGALVRDVVFLGTAAAEGGDVGIEWLIETRPDVVGDVEFALSEGGRIRAGDGAVRTVNIQTAEKVPYVVVARATGPSGPGSVPLEDNALAALARAVSRVHAWRPPVHLNEVTRLYFRRLADVERDPVVAGAMRRVSTSTNERTIRDAADLLSRDPRYNAVLRTGASLTGLDGGIRADVIPSSGAARFDVRIVPGEDIDEVVREMTAVGGEAGVTFELAGARRGEPPPSPVTTDLYRAVDAAAKMMAPGTVVVPFMSAHATDGAALRAHGIPTYGILPFPLEPDDELRLHGDDERVPLEALAWGAEYLYRVLWLVAR